MTAEPLRATISLRGVVFGPDDDVLILRRASDGEWELPGGRLGSDEDTLLGLRREVEEETGLDAAVDGPVHTFAWRNDRNNGRFAVYYRCVAGGVSISLSGEHTDFEWLSPRAATDRLSDPQAEAVTRAREGRRR